MHSAEVTTQKLAIENLRLAEKNGELQELSENLTRRLHEMSVVNAGLTSARDQALRANEAQSHFIASMSQEIRTPMTGMLGMIDFTLDSELNPEQECQLKIARKAGKELVKVINEIIQFTRTVAVPPAVPVPVPVRVAPAPKPGSPRQGTLTVLVVEDDRIIMEVMTRLISRAGHRVITAWDGDEALRIWASERPGLVLMDVKMPNLNGLEATRLIREAEKETGAQVPIYGITAGVLDEDIERCLAAGMTGHLAKPIDFPDVLEILDRHQVAGHPEAAGAEPGGGTGSC